MALTGMRAMLCTLLQLQDALTHHTHVSLDECSKLLVFWLQNFDRSAQPADDTLFNHMHIVGMALCAVVHNTMTMEPQQYDFITALGHFAPRIALCSVPIREMSWRQLSDVVATLQIEFGTLFEPKARGGFHCCVKIQRLLLELLARLGFYFTHDWKSDHATEGTMEELQGMVHTNEEGWMSICDDQKVQILDAIHCMGSASWFMLSANAVPDPSSELNELHNYHREASLDEFYTLSELADCPVGAVVQYAHKFRHLFHSSSQVIFFHFPSYVRPKQVPLNALRADNADAIAVLPLLQQISPTIPVLHEHTGAGFAEVHAKNKWQWVVFGKVVLLSDSNMKVYHGNVRCLLAYTERE